MSGKRHAWWNGNTIWRMRIVANHFERRIPPLHPIANECAYSTYVGFVGHARDVTYGWGRCVRMGGDDSGVPTGIPIRHTWDLSVTTET